jgi:hypothetical protein
LLLLLLLWLLLVLEPAILSLLLLLLLRWRLEGHATLAAVGPCIPSCHAGRVG